VATTSGTSVTITGLTPDSTTWVYVRARDAQGNESSRSGFFEVTTLTTPDTTAPSTPSVARCWDLPVVCESNRCCRQRIVPIKHRHRHHQPARHDRAVDSDDDGAGPVPDPQQPLAVATGTSTTLTGLTPGTQYYIYLRARDAAGNTSGRTGFFSFTTTAGAVAPATPTQPAVANNANGSLTISWDPVPGSTSYNVKRDNVTVITATPIDSTVIVDDNFGAVPSTHTYRVQAVNAAGTSAYSAQSTAVQVTNTDCGFAAGTGRWATAEVCGIWEIINPIGQVSYWNAANIKDNSIGGTHGIDATDIANFDGTFDTVRVALRWDRLQPTNNTTLSGARVSEVKDLLDDLYAADVNVVLDIVHLSGPDKIAAAWSIPDWAWDDTSFTSNASRTKANSWVAWAGPNNDGEPLQNYIDLLETNGILTHDAVIAVEVVNEPHPLNTDATVASGQERLAEVHDELIAHIRTHESDMMVVVGAYFGGLRHGGVKQLDGTYDFNFHGSELTHNNVVWTAHNYYTGVDDNAGINDGQADDGQRDEGLWAEGADSAGCYGNTSGIAANDRDTEWNCPSTPNNRTEAQAGHRNNALGHWEWAQDNDMPFFMGEWGLGRQRYQNSEYRGWDLAEYFYCDKLAAYDDIDDAGTRISWAVWSLDANTDAFGLYYARNTSEPLQSHRSYLTPGTWASTGSFGSESAGWNSDQWTHARPFTDTSYCAALG